MAEDDKEAQMMEAMGLPVKFCSNSKQEEMMKAEALAPEYWCEVCELELNSLDTFDSHCRGQKHIKKLQAYQVSRGLEVLPPAQAGFSNRVKVPVRLGAKVAESNEPVVGLSFLTETLAVSDPQMEPHYTCGLCNQQGQANVMLLHLRGRQHRQNWVLSKFNNASDKMGLSQVALRQEAERWDERFEEGASAIQTVYSDEAFPWPPGKAPWLQENGGTGEVPTAALSNFGNMWQDRKAFCEYKHKVPVVQEEGPGLPSLSSLQPPRTVQEARKLVELGSSLCLAAAESGLLELGPREENLLRAGLAAAVLKLRGQGQGGSD